jgi:hypothetical protein
MERRLLCFQQYTQAAAETGPSPLLGFQFLVLLTAKQLVQSANGQRTMSEREPYSGGGLGHVGNSNSASGGWNFAPHLPS